MRPLFAYGTLQDPEVFLMVTDHMLSHYLPQPALLEGYGIYEVQNENFPGIVEEKGSTTPGLLVHGINHSLLDMIIEYETDSYKLIDVNVQLAKMKVMAQCFYPTEKLKLENKIWKFEDWRIDHKMNYLSQLKHFQNTGSWELPQESPPKKKAQKQ